MFRYLVALAAAAILFTPAFGAYRSISGHFSYADGTDQRHQPFCARRRPRAGGHPVAWLWRYRGYVGSVGDGTGKGPHRHCA